MNPRPFLRTLTSALLLALLLAAIHPAPAFADDVAPPPADAAPEVTPPAEDPLTDDASPAAEATPVPEGAADAAAPDAGSPENVAAEAADEAQPAAGDGLLEGIPDGTAVAVIDAQGEAVPLASQEAQAIVAGGDPIWCPATLKAPTPGLNGCSPSEPSLTALQSWLTTNLPAADGVIWFEDDYDSGTGGDAGLDFIFNGSTTYLFMRDYKLTFRGGWDGLAGSKVITPLNPDDLSTGTEFNGRLYIQNWNNDVTISDIEFTGIGAGGYALFVTQAADSPGSITLTRVVSHDNPGPEGARLVNNAGTGKVTVTSSQFNNNGGRGLYADSRGTITLASVLANDNGVEGAYLYNDYDGVTSAVTLTGASTFNDNERDGLWIQSRGAITANDLTARNNGLVDLTGSGVTLDNDSSLAHAAVKLTGLNIFTGNHNTGLVVDSYGPVTLNSVNANANLNSGGVVITTDLASAQAVTLTGTNSMRYNGNHGLVIDTFGKIAVNNVTANGNAGIGAWLTNDHGLATGDVVLTGVNNFLDNGGTGLQVRSYGSISAANLSAERNNNLGASLLNDGIPVDKPVTLSGINSFRDNWANNLLIQSDGAVTLSSVTASGSTTGGGVYVMNTGATAAQKVALSGTNVFEDNFASGLEIYSRGPVSISSLRTTGNGLVGHYGYGAWISNAGATAQPVTFTGSVLASGNYDSGLHVESLGAITAANLTASSSVNGAGVRLDNHTGSGGVTLTGANTFNANYSNGLQISSAGLVKLNSLTARGSLHGMGANLSNAWALDAAPKDVVLTGTHAFNDNYFDGLYIYTKGAVTLSSATASGNGLSTTSGYGIEIDNSPGTLPKPVTLGGSYTLNDNLEDGLYLRAGGAIKVNNLSAGGNDGRGATLDNSSDPEALGGVTLTGASAFTDNGTYGLGVYSEGAVLASNLTATLNSNSGVYIRNTYGAATVTLSGTNVFTDNGVRGLEVFSKRAITLSNVTASRNLGGEGAYLNNYNADLTSSGGVTLNGTNRFETNDGDGLYVDSLGAITVNSVTAMGNGTDGTGYGAYLRNVSALTPQAIKLTGTNVFSLNHNDGLYARSLGAITASSVTATDNVAGNGAWLMNNFAGSGGGVTLSGTNRFEGNDENGLDVRSYGAITLGSITASGNGLAGAYFGAYIDNSVAPSPMPVTLTGTNAFNGNSSSGLNLNTLGAITAANVTASGNGGRGAALNNGTFPLAARNVTFSGTNVFNDNDENGLTVVSDGAISLNSITARGNGSLGTYTGVELNNGGAATALAIKLTGINAFSDNTGGGLSAISKGAILINNLTAQGNLGGNGATLNNSTGTGGITLTGTNIFSDNTGAGLSAVSTGAVSLAQVTADHNGGTGLSFTGPAASVTITCGSVTSNGGWGIYAEALGLLKLVGVVAVGNTGGDLMPDASFWVITRACPSG